MNDGDGVGVHRGHLFFEEQLLETGALFGGEREPVDEFAVVHVDESAVEGAVPFVLDGVALAAGVVFAGFAVAEFGEGERRGFWSGEWGEFGGEAGEFGVERGELGRRGRRVRGRRR